MNDDDNADRMPTPPDLQKLVELRGGFHKITRADWRLFEQQAAATRAWLDARHRRVVSAKG